MMMLMWINLNFALKFSSIKLALMFQFTYQQHQNMQSHKVRENASKIFCCLFAPRIAKFNGVPLFDSMHIVICGWCCYWFYWCCFVFDFNYACKSKTRKKTAHQHSQSHFERKKVPFIVRCAWHICSMWNLNLNENNRNRTTGATWQHQRSVFKPLFSCRTGDTRFTNEKNAARQHFMPKIKVSTFPFKCQKNCICCGWCHSFPRKNASKNENNKQTLKIAHCRQSQVNFCKKEIMNNNNKGAATPLFYCVAINKLELNNNEPEQPSNRNNKPNCQPARSWWDRDHKESACVSECALWCFMHKEAAFSV